MSILKLASLLLTAAMMGLPAPAPCQSADPAATQARPWMNTALSPEARTKLLLARMTLDEKIALLHGDVGFPFARAKPPRGALGSSGFVPGNPRLGIPALQESDAGMGVVNTLMVRGPNDLSTAFPSSMGLAATFDPALAYAGGTAIGDEARAKTINVQLAGGMNLARDPRNGRNFEYLGEDPLLAGLMAGELIGGIQSSGIISTVKHYAMNDQEHNRQTTNAEIGEAAARESDLLAFEIAIERGKPGAVMCGYNLVNGVHACESPWLLDKVLKHDWGYKGFVMSDWGAVHSAGALTAGLDQESGEELDLQVWFDNPLKAAVAAGNVRNSRVDDAAGRILEAMFAAGLFDRPVQKSEIDFIGHARVARREEQEAIVLLQNRGGILPLPKTARHIVVIGAHAEAGVPSGMGSSQVTTPFRVGGSGPAVTVPIGGEGLMAPFYSVVFDPSSPLAALRSRRPDARISFDTGNYPAAAAAAAHDADVAIVFAYQPMGEGEDAPNLRLPMGQDALIEAVTAANPNTIVVLETGGPIEMPWADRAGAIVEAWYGGSGGGEAIADILTGAVNPSGRLPITWPIDEAQVPRPTMPGWNARPGESVNVDYNREGSDVGYRWYARQNLAPRYWFGYGLSYTGFTYGGLDVTSGKSITAKVTVTNVGGEMGEDVVQLYLMSRNGKTLRRLIGFQKVTLAPRESRLINLTIDPRLLADFDNANDRWRIPAGLYTVAIGTDAGHPQLTVSTRIREFTQKP